MPPPAPGDVKYVTVRQYGGEVGASAVLAPKVGPLGVSPKKVGEDIAKATKEWKGIKVAVQLKVLNRQAEIELIPTATSLLLRELKEPYRDRKKVKKILHSGNLTLKQVVSVAEKMRECNKSLGRTLGSTTREILGTCRALGCTVDGEPPQKLSDAIKVGEVQV